MIAPGGITVVATLNRTLKAFALAIVGAEYLLRWLPRGTHDWRRFLAPAEIEDPAIEEEAALAGVARARQRAGAPEHGLDARQQFARIERL